MNIFKLFKRREVIRASTKEQRDQWRKSDELHQQLAKECGLDVQFNARMGEAQGVK